MADVKSWLPALSVSPLNCRPFQRRKLALIGASSLNATERPPFEDPKWDVWGCNSLWRRHLDKDGLFRADAWWEMHPAAAQTPQELFDMTESPVPMYVLDQNELPSIFQHWITYPFSRIAKAFGSRSYFTNTFAYQVAMAMLLGYQEIGLWGIELWQGSTREQRVELPCLNYWLGLATGKGIKITLPEYSKMLWHEHLYGYDYEEDVAQSAIDDRELAVLWCQEEAGRRKLQDGERFSMGSMLS